MFGSALPTWLLSSGTKVLLRRFVRDKSEPLCDPVELIMANQTYARVRTGEGQETTVLTSDLAPYPNDHQPVVANDLNTALKDQPTPSETTHPASFITQENANKVVEQSIIEDQSNHELISTPNRRELSSDTEPSRPQLRRSQRQRRPAVHQSGMDKELFEYQNLSICLWS